MLLVFPQQIGIVQQQPLRHVEPPLPAGIPHRHAVRRVQQQQQRRLADLLLRPDQRRVEQQRRHRRHYHRPQRRQPHGRQPWTLARTLLAPVEQDRERHRQQPKCDHLQQRICRLQRERIDLHGSASEERVGDGDPCIEE